MADLQPWRRHTHRPPDNAHIHLGQIDEFAPSDHTLYSTLPGADDNKLRPQPRRSLASFASYLGAHHRTIPPSSRPEWSSIDWSNINGFSDKDGVYKPDTELMCTPITQQVLANPSADLPAQYNTFVLHLIEAYHQSKADVQELQIKLAKETECNQTTRDEFHGAISSGSLEKAHMLQSLESPNPNTLQSMGAGNDVIAARLRKHNFTVQTPKSSIEYENSGQRQKQVTKIRTSECHQFMSSARIYHGPSTAAIGVETSCHCPISPLQHGMEFIECDASSADSEGERHQAPNSASNAASGLEDDIASRLAAWLALRLKCQPGDIFSELSELLRSTQKESQKGLARSATSTFLKNMPTASGKIQILPDRSNKIIGTSGSPSCRSIRAFGHRRGFSFLPGDDSTNPISSNVFRGQDMDSDKKFTRPLAWQDTKQSEHGGIGELEKTEWSGEMAVGSRSQQQLLGSVVSPTAGSDVSGNPQQDGSARRVLTTIISSSSRSSSLSIEDL